MVWIALICLNSQSQHYNYNYYNSSVQIKDYSAHCTKQYTIVDV